MVRSKIEKLALSVFLVLALSGVIYFVPYIGAKKSGQIYNDPWNDSVAPVSEYLEKNLKEPGSLQVIEWGKVKKAGTGYSVTCTFRARNSFGGYNVQTEVFLFNTDGYLISTAPMN